MDTSIDQTHKTRIIEHMNDDHADACLLYVHHFAQRTDATAAKLTDIDTQQMILDIDTPQGGSQVSIAFKTPLSSAEDAHHTLIDMVREARGS